MAKTELTGAYAEIVKVTDPDGTATKTTLSFTTDDIELSIEEEEVSVNKHGENRTIRARQYNTADLTFSSLIEPTLETLDETGIADMGNDGKLLFENDGRTWDACFVRIFDSEGATTPDLVYRFDEVEWQMDGITLPADFATSGMTGWIHGDIYLDYTES